MTHFNQFFLLFCFSGYLRTETIQSFCFYPLQAAEEVILELPDGTIKGNIEITLTNRTFYSFMGIPYAEPPVDELRFQAPQPVKPWSNILDASYLKGNCFQVTNDDDSETEDCLFINVYTPRDPSSNASLPVMFFIYGGGFVSGSSTRLLYGPEHFMDYDVIIITFNYRVGPFGFFSTGDSAIPGNAGLKDQLLALQWVQKNIRYFGGDPRKVTIFGESAGSASVAYQVLSPKSKGLFRAAICESGSAMSAWAYQRNQVEYTYQTAGYIDPTFSNTSVDSNKLLEFLTNVTARDLDWASANFSALESPDNLQIQQGFYYAPVVEYDHEDAFITELMYESFKTGNFNHVPMIIGMNSEESLWWYGGDLYNNIVEAFDKDFSLLVPDDMNIKDEDTRGKIGQDIKDLYISNGTFAENTIQFYKYFSDQSFTRSIIKQAELQSNFDDVYFYQFSYRGQIAGNSDSEDGFSDTVRHGEELSYLFVRYNWNSNVYSDDLSIFPDTDVLVLRRFITMFTNFAKSLNPTPDESDLLENTVWPQFNIRNSAYLDIGSSLAIRYQPRNDTYSTWEGLYAKYVNNDKKKKHSSLSKSGYRSVLKMVSNSLTCIGLLVFCAGYLTADDVIVQLPDGQIKGRTEVTITDKTFYSFQGVRFAKPPLDELRFQAPQPVEPWDDVYDATSEKNVCYQVTTDRDDESEDCLFINIYSPNDPADNAGLPVMVFIYGGGFIEGASESVNYGPHHFMDYDVVIVSFNYRVGPFGFFSTGDDAIPGNAGLKDQNMALQWVQSNIQYFGGDPEKVTIFGQSAGGASVTYQILSPKSEGLFRAGISESGSFLSPWAFQRNQVEITYQTAAYINDSITSDTVSTSDLLDFLLSVPAKDLDVASYNFKQEQETIDYNQLQQGFFYAPVVEHDHEGAFFTEPMYGLLEKGEINKVPLIIGVDSEECIFYADDETSLKYTAQGYDEVPNRLYPLDMHLGDDDDTISTVVEEIKELYVENATFSEKPINIIRYLTDQCFIRSIIKHAELQSQYTDVYFYQFSYYGLLGGHASQPAEGFSDQCRHGEEISYLFRRGYGGYNTTDLSQYPESDVLVLRRMLTMFTNFAKYLAIWYVISCVVNDMVDSFYRLGFFSTGDDAISGNAGLKDQTMALQWIQNNIQYFGGGSASQSVEGFSDQCRHSEEGSYLSRRNYASQNTTDLSQYPEADVLVLRRMLTMFTNFAKYLNLTPEEIDLLQNITWPTVSTDNFSYLDVGSDTSGRNVGDEPVETVDDLLVKTTTGWIRGGYGGTTVGQGKPVYQFRSIPFAEPPVGDLRFEVLKPRRQKKLPVMVWIYGGAFFAGAPDFSDHSPDYLLDEDVIVVSFHYRVGIFGFLSTGDRVVPGNNGLKDQVLALRWIKDNIQSFGGDPDRNNYIWTERWWCLSGLSPAIESDPSLSRNAPDIARTVAQNLDIDSSSSQSLVEGLKGVSAEELQEVAWSSMVSQLLTSNPRDGLVFTPVIEPEHEGAILTENSHQLLERGEFNRVPLIIGYNSLEALLSEIPELLRIWLLLYDVQPSRLVPVNMNIGSSLTRASVGLNIKTKYFGLGLVSASTRRVMTFISDDQFERPIQESARLYSRKVPVYFYRFSYEGALWGVTNRTTSGVGHTEELGYLFDFKYPGSEEDYITRQRMVKLWTNFAKSGNPTPEEERILQEIIWEPNTASRGILKSLEIDTDLELTSKPNAESIDYWEELYDRYGVPPYDTY
ncbi:hypothetical protein NQ317_016424 [Molorchus minor]|uniref:Carboxylesterase type B domain-containing protein n=1 Tax=Molorchus minor TaxID=1323400 RepID=A0ABQ9JYN6_9CUCU|nr:hypothetical protein NQ317_016424 [Molorchus minor]